MRMRGMARWLKTPEDVKAAAAYVASLPKVVPTPTLTGGDATRGGAVYATCAACHGQEGEGNQAIGGPPLAHTSDWYLMTQIKNYQQGIRGGDPRDVQGTAMRPMAMMMPDEQAIKDVLAHIAAWEDVVRRRLAGERVEPSDAEDWPPAGEGGESAWKALLDRLEAGNRALRETILAFDLSRLDQPPSGSTSTAYVSMHGAVQHDLYHAGQIALLKKGARP